MTRSSIFALALFCVLLVPAGPGKAQGTANDFSVWLGGATDQFEETLPISPQLGTRFEISPARFLWLGAEATGLFVNESLSCPGTLASGCEDAMGISVTPALSGQLRLELDGGEVRPYVTGVVGRAIRGTSTSSTLLGGGIGVRIPDRLLRDGVSLEVRYRHDDRFSILNYDHWEFLFGMSP